MPFTVVRNDITHMQVDAIVNTANPLPVIGAGTDAAIHEKAGPRLLKARQKVGDICVGKAALTPAFRLKARYVIHTAGPVWSGGCCGEEALLRSCYDSCLQLALAHRCQSIAFPLICAGHYGFPRDQALQIAISAFTDFLAEQEMQIFLVVYENASFRLSEALSRGVASYIDDHYVHLHRQATQRSRQLPSYQQRQVSRELSEAPAPCQAPCASLEDMLRRADAGFTQTLLQLIDRSGKKDSQIYKKANLSKQHFSKIRNNPQYQPTKATAIALALALELDLEQTRDLIGRAGFALTNSSKFDLIIQYFIQQKNYNIVNINIALYEFDQPLLGG